MKNLQTVLTQRPASEDLRVPNYLLRRFFSRQKVFDTERERERERVSEREEKDCVWVFVFRAEREKIKLIVMALRDI